MNEELLVIATLTFPTLAVLVLGVLLWRRKNLSERAFASVTGWTFVLSLASAVALVVWMFIAGQDAVVAHVGRWFSLGDYHFDWVLVADRLSLPFLVFCVLLLSLIGAFSRRYLHRESGYFRFYFLLLLFGAAVILVILGGSLDLVFVGWEVVGLTSALLIAFFHERKKPVEHGFRAFITYRFCDIGLLAAAVWMHHTVQSTEMIPSLLSPWNGLPVPASSFDATLIGLLIVWATMGKSAQVPFGGWLPRAMEGPTPSSAIFYGAISVHLGPYLLLRATPLIETSALVRFAVIFIGATTAIHGTFVGRVQSDIKSALAYASMTQVGIIFVEIGLGFHYLALVHIVGHAALRSLQILRSPSLLHDYHHLEQAMGDVLPKTGGHLERLIPRRLQPWLYRHALERGYFDIILRDWIVGGFVRSLRRVDRLEQRWTAWLSGSGAVQAQRSDEQGEAK